MSHGPSALVLILLALSACGGDEAGATSFTLTFENISAPGSLSTSDGGATDVIFAAGVWALLEDGGTLFTPGEAASSQLERIAEDGENIPLMVQAEDRPDIVAAGTLAEVDVTTYAESPLRPGVSIDIEVEAYPEQALSFVSMFVQSNDVFVAPAGGGLSLFDGSGDPRSGDVTSMLAYYDAGSEVNEEPGLGPNQPPRQAEHGDGEAEGGVITRIDGSDAGGFDYPALGSALRLTITPR